MQPDPVIAVDKKEVFRYLGLRGNAPGPELSDLVDACLLELRSAVTPRFLYRRFPIRRFPGTDPDLSPDSPAPLLSIAGREIYSLNLARNLRDCQEAFLMAATLGLGPDRLIARASVGRMSRAVVLQAASAAMIEAWCDLINEQIRVEAERDGLSCRPRFSPGYGDFPLSFQRDFEQILHMQKEIGVALTESLLMMPSKSVTAVIGLSEKDAGCSPHGCEECPRQGSCAFSRTVPSPTL